MATVYLDDNIGNDSNTYAQAQNPATPWLTLSKVNTSATTGDTVQFLTAGTYTFPSATFTKNFTWIGATTNPADTVISRGSGTASWAFVGTTQTMSYCTIYAGSGGIPFSNTGGSAVTQFTFNNCIFLDVIYNMAAGQAMFQNYQSVAHAGYQLVFNRCVFDNPKATAGGTSTGIFWNSLTYAKISMNKCTLAVKDATYGSEVIFKTESGVKANEIKNSCWTNISGKTCTLVSAYSGSGDAPTYPYSNIYGFTGSVTGTGSSTADPLFVGVSSSNYNLQKGSPAIDTGTNT